MVLTKLCAWIQSRAIALVHFEAPRASFSLAAGLRDSRATSSVDSAGSLPPADRARCAFDDFLCDFICRVARDVWRSGGHWTISSIAKSRIWRTPSMQSLFYDCMAFPTMLHTCAFGAAYRRAIIFYCTHRAFFDLGCTCPGPPLHRSHQQLRGSLKDPRSGVRCTSSSIAARYPPSLCSRYARLAHLSICGRCRPTQPCLPPACLDSIDQFRPVFDIKHSDKRKRPLGQAIERPVSRQRRSGALAIDAGYQLKRTAIDPILNVELEPGATVAMALDAPHPFFRSPCLHPSVDRICQALHDDLDAVVQKRWARLQFWYQRALDLKDASIAEIRAVPDRHLRNLLFLNVDKPDSDRDLGDFVHFALWREMARAAGSGDCGYVDEFKQGFDIVGEVARSFVWDSKVDAASISVSELDSRAWEIRAMIDRRVLHRRGGEHGSVAMADSIKDVDSGFSLGPFYTYDEVSSIVGTDRWIGTERFTIIQKDKARNIDSATASMVNPATSITEHLDIASTDANIGLLRRLGDLFPPEDIWSWVLDEKNAYRWIPIKPSQRRYAVICVYDHDRSSIAYFVMVGHPFGVRSAVYNYNRRSLLLNTILRNEFDVLSSFYYDDKFCFEPYRAILSSLMAATCLHVWVGAIFNMNKLALTDMPKILGVLYDLANSVVTITDDRRASLLQTIEEIFASDRLGPGLAGKLKGRLSFASTQRWGKIGRSFLRALSERQYSSDNSQDLTPPISLCLREWARLITTGRPRPIASIANKPADVVIFTDGFFPNPDRNEFGEARVGGVMFDRCRSHPMTFTLVIKESMMAHWLPRKTQISMVEMFAPILAIEFLGEAIRGKAVLFFVDSEPVEGALVKGYSARDDICELTSVFWQLVSDLDIDSYIDRVSTDANIADGPSRDDPEFWAMAKALHWAILDTWVPDYLDPERSNKGLGV